MEESLENTSLKVFLCHAHSDRETVRALWSRLKRDGVDAWLDREKLQPGQNWEREIHKAILKSHVVIICLSNGFNEQGGFRHKELKIALKKADVIPDDEVFIIPVRLEECDMPESLTHLHRVDMFEAGGYKRLIQALRNRVGSG
jgi:hypothetical protein